MTDTTKHQGQRRQLVKLLEEKGIEDKRVLTAVGDVPRHLFMDKGLEAYAYVDKAYPIAAEQTISQPYTVAFQTQLMELKKGDSVLEIGTGSGYQTAVLMTFDGIKLYTIERQQELFKKTALLFKKLRLTPKKVIFGDGYKGLPEKAPFDAIIVTAGAPQVPKPLLEQLAIGGKLVIPVGSKDQIMTRYVRTGEKAFDKKTFGSFKFVPLLKDRN
ncbi:MAG: protein-L-isoaspartate(D-aspartate) O-methyltransferase [Flavobacteriaceae bacterium]|jgi:protein-L-isoaspartate(D-aspartate) O-methyltransferase|nr:protein-L-isoaspartate(D-aspartate) O-methyltransferase [Flavobacteriaceae bacterium]MDG1965658.1 protein-L-isoaspartate(D-aspartate) O-methyltransferase [Flavobacteriaceae bacterium]